MTLSMLPQPWIGSGEPQRWILLPALFCRFHSDQRKRNEKQEHIEIKY